MGRIILFAGIILGVFYPQESGKEWAIAAAIVLILLGGYISRCKRIAEQANARFIIIDKRKSLINFITSLIISLSIFSYWYFRVPGEAATKAYFIALHVAVLVTLFIAGDYIARYELYEDFISYKRKKLPYSEITFLREDSTFFMLDTVKYINHIKWKRELVFSEIAEFLSSKISR